MLTQAVGLHVPRRRAKPPDPAKKDRTVITRLLIRPGAAAAFVVGILVYLPSPAVIAVVQVVATSKARAAASFPAIALTPGG